MDNRVDITDSRSGNVLFAMWPVIVYSHREGLKHRAIAVPNLGLSISSEALASCCAGIFDDLSKTIYAQFDNVVKRTFSPVSTADMIFSPAIILYTNALMVENDDVIAAFSKAGYLVNIINEVEMHKTVFISYGGPDEDTASKINEFLKSRGITTWFFPNDATPGDKLHRVMHGGVNRYDRVLLLCSESSLSRPGVMNELERVVEREAKEGGSDILVPVALDDYVFTRWRPLRSDLADHVKSRVISTIRIPSAKLFEEDMAKVLKALKK
jgi:hypothetical protein